MTEEEEYYAWLDGELDAEGAARVAARVAADRKLAKRAEEERSLRDTLRGAFAPVMTDGIAPPRFETGEVIHLASARERRAARPISVRTQWAAMAATLVLGIATGTMLSPGSDGPVVRENGALVASASLEEALYPRLASAPAGEGPRIGLTFRDKAGSLCRSFSDETVSGLACREGGDWKIRGMFQGSTQPQGDYRMAAGEDPRLATLIDETIAGEPLDAAGEQAAKERGWR